MPGGVVNINTDAAVRFTNNLERVSRSALPITVRSTLNQAAFELKKEEMPKQFKSTFTQRRKGFERRFSRVMMASGFNINTMKAVVGFTPHGEQAVEDLQQQEYGGIIRGRTFIPIRTARTGGNPKKNVRPANRIPGIKFKRVKKGGRKARQQLFLTAKKQGTGNFILYENTLFQIKKIEPGNLKLLPLYSFEKGRSVKIQGTGFMRQASVIVAKKMEQMFINQSKKRLLKELHKK